MSSEHTKESIVMNAWEMVTEFPSLKKLNFIPSFAGMLWLLIILLYQLTFTYILVFHQKDAAIEALANFLHTSYFSEVVITLVIIFILFLFLEPVATGGMIEMMHSYKKHKGTKNRRSWQGFFDGLGHFLPILELHNLTSIFRPIPIITSYIFLLRLFGMQFLTPLTIGVIIYFFLAFFLGICFSYGNFFVILEKKSALQALSASTGMAIRNISITGRLYFTSILLYLRTIIVGIIFLLIPFFISAVISFLPIPILKSIFVIGSLILSLIFFIFIVHLNSTLEIFVLATWFEAYNICKEEDKEHTSQAHHDDHGHDAHATDHSGHDDHGHH